MDGKQTHWNATAPEIYCCSKRFQFCDGKHTEETLATAEVVIPYGSIVLLSSCVENVNLYLLSIQHHLLPVAVGFGGLIVFNKLWVKKKKKCCMSSQLWSNRPSILPTKRMPQQFVNFTCCEASCSPHHTWTGAWGLIFLLLHCPP